MSPSGDIKEKTDRSSEWIWMSIVTVFSITWLPAEECFMSNVQLMEKGPIPWWPQTMTATTVMATRYTMTSAAMKTWKTNGVLLRNCQISWRIHGYTVFRKSICHCDGCGRHGQCLCPSLLNPLEKHDHQWSVEGTTMASVDDEWRQRWLDRSVTRWRDISQIQYESKKTPWNFLTVFPKRLGIFSPNFTCL